MKNGFKKTHVAFMLIIISIFFTTYCISQNSQVGWSSLNMGYAEPRSGNTLIKSIAGQSFVGTARQSSTQVISGFFADTLFRSTIVEVKDEDEMPACFSLWQNYPNPFNPVTTIHVELPKESHIAIKVFNVLGQEVMTLLNEDKPAGKYDIHLDASQLSCGVYIYRLISNDYNATKKFLLLK